MCLKAAGLPAGPSNSGLGRISVRVSLPFARRYATTRQWWYQNSTSAYRCVKNAGLIKCVLYLSALSITRLNWSAWRIQKLSKYYRFFYWSIVRKSHVFTECFCYVSLLDTSNGGSTMLYNPHFFTYLF